MRLFIYKFLFDYLPEDKRGAYRDTETRSKGLSEELVVERLYPDEKG